MWENSIFYVQHRTQQWTNNGVCHDSEAGHSLGLLPKDWTYYVCPGVWNWGLSYLPLTLGPWNFHIKCIYVWHMSSQIYRERPKDLCSGDMHDFMLFITSNKQSNRMLSQIPLDQLDCLFCKFPSTLIWHA